MPDIDPASEAIKLAMKEAIREWLDERFAELGRWTLRGLAAAMLAGLLWLMLISQGWHKGP